MNYKIETGIPIPKPHDNMNRVYSNTPKLDFLFNMKHGESVFIHPSEAELKWITDKREARKIKHQQVYAFLLNRLKKIDASFTPGQYFVSRKWQEEDKKGHRWFCLKEI